MGEFVRGVACLELKCFCTYGVKPHLSKGMERGNWIGLDSMKGAGGQCWLKK